MKDLKEALIYQISHSTATSNADLFSEIFQIFYAAAFKDGQHYMEVREE